ncbi:unnamed protein product [Pleuronectes platessa]|uniref:Uncharacterized protein n=1 Tax=Pleuronectes platessa TaxID=8262 RepID=A0A9N7UQE1_PLEPL|nr:unnamed protein product [Pleuronectes platessa]
MSDLLVLSPLSYLFSTCPAALQRGSTNNLQKKLVDRTRVCCGPDLRCMVRQTDSGCYCAELPDSSIHPRSLLELVRSDTHNNAGLLENRRGLRGVGQKGNARGRCEDNMKTKISVLRYTGSRCLYE